MNKKHKAISMGSTLLVVAMLSLVGVGFAITYTGSATVNTAPNSAEYVTVSATSTLAEGIYTVNTVNNGSSFSLSDLKFWDVDDNVSTPTLVSSKHFEYEAGAFSLVNSAPVANGYESAVAGTVTISIDKPVDSSTNTVNLTVSGMNAPVINQYGLSMVYTYTIDGVEEVCAPNTTKAIPMDAVATKSVVLTAYVVYSSVANGPVSAFSMAGANVSVTATASYVEPSP